MPTLMTNFKATQSLINVITFLRENVAFIMRDTAVSLPIVACVHKTPSREKIQKAKEIV
jgi:hypothetical protein